MARASQDEGEGPASSKHEELRAAMIAYQGGSLEAFERVYALLSPRLRRLLLARCRDQQAAEDLMQETFLQIHRGRRTYDPAFPVGGWADAIARHVFLMDRRARSRRGGWGVTGLSEAREPSVRPHEEGVIAGDELKKGLAQLTPGRRSAVLHHHLWGWSFAEIARALGIPERVARQRSSRGMATLRRWIRTSRGSNGD